MGSIEILAPAGGPEQLVAAVRCGADAVYLGTKGFNARQNATNFDGAALGDTVAYCHARNVRVLVTLNTLVSDRELPALQAELRHIAEAGADAVIVQDLAVAALVRACCPDLALHASTQMTLHNVAGAQQAKALGFSRMVLARELTLEEIRAISQEAPLETECFVHGALCMSVSGACYLSAMLGGRSGNRGLCAQPCRLAFSHGDRPYALSLKDMSYLEQIQALQEAGVASLKIEGRMKRPEYVAAAVSACVAAREGKPYDREKLEAAFSRSGFTDGYLTGRRTLSMFGVRRGEDKAATEAVCASLTALYRRERSSVPVDMALTARADEPVALEVRDGEHRVRVQGEAAQAARNLPATQESVRRSLEKTGGTPFALRTLHADMDAGLAVPGAALNALRREALEALLAERSAVKPLPYFDNAPEPQSPHQAPARPARHLRVQRAEQLFAGLEAERVIVPLSVLSRQPELLERFGHALAAEVPQLVYPDQEAEVQAALQRLAGLGLSAAVAENIGAIRWILDAGLEALGGHGLNVMNALSLAEYQALGLSEVTVSFEMNLQKIRALGGTCRRGLLAYGHLPLMQLRCCPAQGKHGCGACDGRPTIKDRRGADFPLLCNARRYSTLLNPIPLSLSGRALEAVDFYTLYFTLETPEDCRRVVEAFDAGQSPQGAFTTGLYYKNLQG